MRFLHTADWQIGMNAAACGPAAAVRLREERLAAGTRAVQVARDQRVEFILMAGDLFEDNAVDRTLVQRTADILAAFGGPVYLLPGNHDPLVPGSVWEYPAWRTNPCFRVLRDEAAVELPSGHLYPCPIRERHSSRVPTLWIPAQSAGDIRIGLAHGTVVGLLQDEPDYPIPRDAAEQAGLDYLALGHWHSLAVYQASPTASIMAYSGTHETSRFGERDSGSVLIVEIAGPGSAPQVRPVRTGGLHWLSLVVELGQPDSLAALRRQLDELTAPQTTLVSLELSGLLAASERDDLSHLEAIVATRFLAGRLDCSQVRPSPHDDQWVSQLPAGVVRDAATRLLDNPGESPETAAQALLELYALLQEAPQ